MDWHIAVQVTHILVCVPLAHLNKVLSVLLSHVVLQPWEVELIVAEADEIEERFNIVDWVSLSLHVELSHRRKHRVTLQKDNFVFAR